MFISTFGKKKRRRKNNNYYSIHLKDDYHIYNGPPQDEGNCGSLLGTTVNDAVVSDYCPCLFQRLSKAGYKMPDPSLGMNVLRIINEPTAAAITYGLDKTVIGEHNVLIFNLG